MERFWSKVIRGDPDICWPWVGGTTNEGYGRFKVNGKLVSANRVAYELTTQSCLLPQIDACHTCDNPNCVNPEHLFACTRQENMIDCRDKGRLGSHIPTPITKIDRSRYSEIQNRYQSGESLRILADEYGVSYWTIRQIVKVR